MDQHSQVSPRRRRFRLRFGLRGFFVLVILLSVTLTFVIQRSRQQQHVCKQLSERDIQYEMNDPPLWLQFLPQRLLNLYDGHLCRTVKKVSLDFESDQIASDLDAELALLAELPKLENLEVRFANFDGKSSRVRETLSQLRRIQGLRRLELQTDQVREVIEALPELPDLLSLSIIDQTVTGYHSPKLFNQSLDMSAVLKFPSLTDLELGRVVSANDNLKPLASLRRLRTLKLHRLRVSAASIACFARHPNLEAFIFDSRCCSDEVLKILATCPKLKSINASGSLVTDKGLSYLADMPQLERLRISGVSITDAGFANLVHCEALTSISCGSCNLSDAIGPTLKKLTKLTFLQLYNTSVTTSILSDLQSLKRLEHLEFDPRSAELTQILAYLKNTLRLPKGFRLDGWSEIYFYFGSRVGLLSQRGILDLSDVRGVSGQLGKLRASGGIEDLRLRGSDITDRDMRDISAIATLESLDVSNTSITADALADLNKLPTLQTLTVGPFEDVDKAIQSISQITSLEQLKIFVIGDIKQSGQDALVGMSNLQDLDILNYPVDQMLKSRLLQMPALQSLDTVNLNWQRPGVVRGWEFPHWNDEDSDTRAIQFDWQDYAFSNRLKDFQKKNSSTDIAVVVSEASDLDFLPNIRIDRLSCASVSLSHDDVLKLARFDELNELDLSNTGITDQDVAVLAELEHPLQRLNLSGNPITDNVVDALLTFEMLYYLNLANTGITDSGVARILTSDVLDEIDLGGTSITGAAWAQLNRVFASEVRINVAKTAAFASILQQAAIGDFPNIKVVEADGFALNCDDILDMRECNERRVLGTVSVTPSLLKIWPVREVLSNKDVIRCLRIDKTDQLREVLQLAKDVSIVSLEISNESLDSSINLPNSIRSVELKNCVITTPFLEALTNCQWLARINFNKCDFRTCDIEPLDRVPMLSELGFKKTILSKEQYRMLQQMQTKLKVTWANNHLFW